MKSIVRKTGLIAGAMLMLAGCGSFDGKREGGPTASPTPGTTESGIRDTPVKIGDPYSIGGTTYTPSDIADYDDVGYASWYGEELAGRPTANGEIFDPAGVSAAHKTLPLPSYVEVTALDTGRTILVRVNDRGPMVGDRLIDLSRGAAEQLGLSAGVSAVRVRRTNPPLAERAQLRAGHPVPERIATPDSLLSILRTKLKTLPVPKALAATPPVDAQPAAPIASGKAKPGDDRMTVETAKPIAKPTAVTKPAPAVAGKYVVQVGAFSSESRANATAKSVGGTVSKAGNLWRVRIGPFASDAEARGALNTAKAKGFRDAVVQRDR
ncbi:septal ring lytic transglycosylase RlpA family protein [Sphingopyxis sp.]|mgnify:CR=1 FL=1|jgi:rare lipoprotein A|uniref:septal ring lytic transglycosylase RlpA family protein n=1 Tax=Sphingopyxis sp. TaxID=1908224 RepID=UPI0025F8E73A|nr:septal ring lytic transglycosylase RlpA family protein [Sphingopyxis sp.]MBK6413248.1 septal ring lytic transglycosylase RlpA family protein [Sphingopyxis sp.]